MASSSIRPVERVQRAVDVLRTVNSIGDITISELAKITGLSRGATERYVKTFASLGFVTRSQTTRRYSVTDKVAILSKGAPNSDWKSVLAKPLLLSACEKVGWPLSLSVLRNGHLTVVENTDDASPLVVIPMRDNISVPIAGRAGAHVLLAEQPAQVVDQILLVAEKRDPHLLSRINMTRQDFRAYLDQVKKQGYDVTRIPGSKWATIATPVRQGDLCTYSVSVRFRHSAVSLDQAVARFKATIVETARKVAERIPTDGSDQG